MFLDLPSMLKNALETILLESIWRVINTRHSFKRDDLKKKSMNLEKWIVFFINLIIL